MLFLATELARKLSIIESDKKYKTGDRRERCFSATIVEAGLMSIGRVASTNNDVKLVQNDNAR
jgi:hypothetical protein